MTREELNDLIEKTAEKYGINLENDGVHKLVGENGEEKDLLLSLDEYTQKMFSSSSTTFTSGYEELIGISKLEKIKKTTLNKLDSELYQKINYSLSEERGVA